MWLLVVIRHKDNVIRFIHGKENTLSIVGKNEVKELDDEGNEKSQNADGDTAEADSGENNADESENEQEDAALEEKTE